jgi:hypothetical protein
MTKSHTGFKRSRLCHSYGRFDTFATVNDDAPVTSTGCDFCEGSATWNKNLTLHAEVLCGESQTSGMVAGTSGNDTLFLQIA